MKNMYWQIGRMALVYLIPNSNELKNLLNWCYCSCNSITLFMSPAVQFPIYTPEPNCCMPVILRLYKLLYKSCPICGECFLDLIHYRYDCFSSLCPTWYLGDKLWYKISKLKVRLWTKQNIYFQCHQNLIALRSPFHFFENPINYF